MEINWQDIFYITSSIAMITTFFALIWIMWLIRNFVVRIQQWDHGVDEIKYFIAEVKLKASKFLLKILDKKNQDKTK